MASHRDLKAWQRAKTLAVGCLRISRAFPADEQDHGLADRLRRAATSAALNIAEGCNRGSNKDFRKFLETARTSLDEVEAIVEIANEAGYIRDEVRRELQARCDEAAWRLYGLLRAINLRIESGEVDRSRRIGTKPEQGHPPA